MARYDDSRRAFLRRAATIACGGSAAALFPQLRMIGTALAGTPGLPGYKALVCLNLVGGNDSWNLLAPLDAARHGIYAAARGGVHHPQSNPEGLALALPDEPAQQIVDGNDASAATNRYFVPPEAAPLADLYRRGQLAFAVNAGPLVQPVTMADYGNLARTPAQLFSHRDQADFWHQASTRTTTIGWGGHAADLVVDGNANRMLSPCISIGGDSRFLNGVSTVPYQLSQDGIGPLAGVCNPTPCGNNDRARRDKAFNDLLAETYASDFADEYAGTFRRARDLYTLVRADLDATTVATAFPDTVLGRQLAMVARMIKLSKAHNYAARQIYYVSLTGFDLHSGLMSLHGGLLRQVSDAVAAFHASMAPADVGASNEVTLFTVSEFARTLQSNGAGSDHGWGGVQFVAGGAVRGGRLYADGGGPIRGFPDQRLDAPDTLPRGRLIPGIGADQYAATLAQWFGITSAGDLAAVFPNLANFNRANLGFV